MMMRMMMMMIIGLRRIIIIIILLSPQNTRSLATPDFVFIVSFNRLVLYTLEYCKEKKS